MATRLFLLFAEVGSSAVYIYMLVSAHSDYTSTNQSKPKSLESRRSLFVVVVVDVVVVCFVLFLPRAYVPDVYKCTRFDAEYRLLPQL